MYWLIFFLMLPHMKPKCVNYLFPEYRMVFEALRVVSLLVVVALFIRAFVKEKKLPSPPTWVLGFLEAWICLITILNNGDIVQAGSLSVGVMGIALLVDLFADKPRELMGALMLNFEWSVYANLHTVLKWPEEGFVFDVEYELPIYFFGPDNWFIYLCIPAVCVALLFLRMEWSRSGRVCKLLGVLRAATLIAASYACVYVMWTVTAMVALATFAVVMLLILIPGVRHCVSYPVVFVGGIGTNLAIAVFRVSETVPAIKNFIDNTLHKNITLTGRTELWSTFSSHFKGLEWTGLGVTQGGYFSWFSRYDLTWRRYSDHMHNLILDTLIQGGIPALLLFGSVFVLVGIPLTRRSKTMSARIMTAAMAALLVMAITEVCRHSMIYLLFPLAWHAGKFENFIAQTGGEVSNQ